MLLSWSLSNILMIPQKGLRLYFGFSWFFNGCTTCKQIEGACNRFAWFPAWLTCTPQCYNPRVPSRCTTTECPQLYILWLWCRVVKAPSLQLNPRNLGVPVCYHTRPKLEMPVRVQSRRRYCVTWATCRESQAPRLEWLLARITRMNCLWIYRNYSGSECNLLTCIPWTVHLLYLHSCRIFAVAFAQVIGCPIDLRRHCRTCPQPLHHLRDTS